VPAAGVSTIGHSTRKLSELVDALRSFGVRTLVDVRTVPRSRHCPTFNTETLPESLREAGIGYRHEKGLGGLRKPLKDSVNGAWRNESIRGFADYLQTETFAATTPTSTAPRTTQVSSPRRGAVPGGAIQVPGITSPVTRFSW